MRRDALEAMKRQVADAARLGARVAYVVPGFDAAPAALARFGEACALLAEFAAGLRVRLGVEHFPRRALPSVAATLEWLEAVGHANFGLLLDVGHCQISGEEPAAAVRRAGARLAYVHFDDNDGVGDVHWPLLTGRLTEAGVRDVFTALRAVGYDGGLAIELHPATPDVAGALRDGKALLDACLARSGGA